MNVSCPQCATVFRVDPAKVPERGVRARCSECGGLIAVRRPQVGTPAVPPVIEATQPAIAPPPQAPAPAPAASPAPASPPPPPAPEPVAPPVATAPEPVVERPPVVEPAPEPVPAPRMPVSVPLTAMPVEAPAPRPTPAPSAAPGRFSNPFLQQDPSVRARRLARALVSDLVVYHPDKRQRGLADGNLKELFAEEIRKSWEEYSEQIGEDVARSTPYFTEALNEILAEGRQLFD